MSISQHARMTPDKPALIVADTGEVLTFGELDKKSRRLAHLLRSKGLKSGERIGLLLENGPNYLIAVWAVRRVGLLYVPINWHLTQSETAYILDDSDSVALITSEKHMPLARKSLEAAPKVSHVFAFGPPLGSLCTGRVI